MRELSRMRWAALTAALLITGAGCGASAPGEKDAASGSATASTPDASSLADAVDTLGRERFAPFYAGIVMENGRVVVYRRPGSALDDSVAALPGSALATFRDARYGAAQLQPLRERVESDIAYWAGRGITVSAVAIPPQGTGVEVTTPQPDRARTEFPARYGPDPAVLVVAGGPIAVPTATTS